MKSVTKLICRDLRRAFGLRTLGIWVVMALFTIYFFFFSNGRRELVENNRLEYMSLFLPLIIFGAWAVMAVFFDLISLHICNLLKYTGIQKGSDVIDRCA